MCIKTFEFGTFPFLFVYSSAKVLHLEEIDIAKCNTNIAKCNL